MSSLTQDLFTNYSSWVVSLDGWVLTSGIIKAMAGNDFITGIGAAGDEVGIDNGGTIDTGAGNDTVDALFGGSVMLIGIGTIDLGIDNYTLKGFGQGTFIDGNGTDKILLGAGTYTITGGGHSSTRSWASAALNLLVAPMADSSLLAMAP